MKMKKNIILVGLILLAIFVTGCSTKMNSEKPIACTQEAKICPDGSSVGRTGPNCEFAPCPKETYSCQQDSDCVLAINLNECCSCPAAYLKADVEKNESLAIYEHGKDYRNRKYNTGEVCSDVACSPCPNPYMYDLKCIEGQCKIAFKTG